MSRTWFSFSLLLCDEIQTLYVTGCKVTPITGPAEPFRVYVLVKKLKNLVTAALTEIPYVLRAIYRISKELHTLHHLRQPSWSALPLCKRRLNTAQFDLLL